MTLNFVCFSSLPQTDLGFSLVELSAILTRLTVLFTHFQNLLDENRVHKFNDTRVSVVLLSVLAERT